MATKNLYKKIVNAVQSGQLAEPFNVKSVNAVIKNLLSKSPSFLSKHCLENPGKYSEMFIRIRKGVYSHNKNYHQ